MAVGRPSPSPARLRRACDPLGRGHEPLPSGRFTVDASVKVEPEDGAGLERLARYIMRAPLSLERMRWDEGAGNVAYTLKPKDGRRASQESLNPLDSLARLIAHVPEPKLHLAYYYGWYSNVSRGRRRKGRDASPSIAPPSREAAEHPYP